MVLYCTMCMGMGMGRVRTMSMGVVVGMGMYIRIMMPSDHIMRTRSYRMRNVVAVRDTTDGISSGDSTWDGGEWNWSI